MLLDKHSHGLSEPRAKHQFANKVTKPIRRFRVAKYTPRKSTSLFISCNKQPNHTERKHKQTCESEVITSLDFIQPFWTAERSPVKARRSDATIAFIPPCGGIPVCIELKAGASPAEPKQSYNGKPRSPYGFGERGLSWRNKAFYSLARFGWSMAATSAIV